MIVELIASVLVLAGAFFCFTAALGVLRFPDVLTRLHAATKPQVFGLLLILLGVGVALHTPIAISICLVIIVFQVMTAPVAAHMVSRTAYRLGIWRSDQALADELADDLAEAGFVHDQSDASYRPWRTSNRLPKEGDDA